MNEIDGLESLELVINYKANNMDRKILGTLKTGEKVYVEPVYVAKENFRKTLYGIVDEDGNFVKDEKGLLKTICHDEFLNLVFMKDSDNIVDAVKAIDELCNI